MKEVALFIFLLGILLLGLRTGAWHLQMWQRHEYRWDRLREFFCTVEGKKAIWSWCFFVGWCPRPQISSRIIMVVGFLIILSVLWVMGTVYLWELCFGQQYHEVWLWPSWAIWWERSLWILTALAVYLSGWPVKYARARLFNQAKKIISQADHHVLKIGITGSYGKSSTKKILVHLLKKKYGKAAVLYNPANENNEVAIARLVVKRRDFFQKKGKLRFFVCEAGAYAPGEIAQVCRFLSPDYSILTGINDQHLPLFGSAKKLLQAKSEMAIATKKLVVFNADSPLADYLPAQNLSASLLACKASQLTQVQVFPQQTKFIWQKQAYILPWAGSGFVNNAHLVLCLLSKICDQFSASSTARDMLDIPLPSNALTIRKTRTGYWLLEDLYSANPTGVLQAIAHLQLVTPKGRRIFIGLPMKELGSKAKSCHEQIFYSLKSSQSQVFWLRRDFIDLGKEILGDDFTFLSMTQAKTQLLSLKSSLQHGDGVLLESRLPSWVVDIFSVEQN